MRVNKVEIAHCSIPLPRAISLGPTRITSRDFVALRATTDCGRHGEAIGYPRGSALFDEARLVADYYLGSDPFKRRLSWETVGNRLTNSRAAVLRAMSLFDIAMADLVAKSCDQPLGALMGGFRSQVPVMAVAGYFLSDRSIDDVAREVSDLFEAGYQRVKIMLSGSDPLFDLALAKAVVAVAPGRVAADAHWSWSTISEAFDTCRRLDDLGLLFIEDPFGPTSHLLLPGLAAKLRTPLAAGEDMPGHQSLTGLLSTVGRLRVDATTCGGVTAAQIACEAAAGTGIAVIPHIFPMLHAQMAAALPGIEMIEEIPSATLADPLHELLARDLQVRHGQCQIDQEPGAGIALDWNAVGRFAVRSETLAMQEGACQVGG